MCITESSCYTAKTQYCKSKKKKKQRLPHSPRALGPWLGVTSLGAWAGFGLKVELSGGWRSWGDEPKSPLDLWCQVCPRWDHSPDSASPLKSCSRSSAPKDWWTCWAGRAWKSLHVSWWLVPASSLLQLVVPPLDNSTLSLALLQGLGFLRGVKGQWEEGTRHKAQAISSPIFSSPWQPRKTGLGLWLSR